ncbi:PIG-L family deacetylase [Hymenobacter artigasi]|uniref:LmbE family N-acetylglucosaminyl deacetylase n=1 Tax=Hymenobacter artigasi TaxID=2719616 RepID=A0ABX1HN63_9BACT|nr:PIG-L family deacetylase [Hymenobacter artigasi]NKI90542.1 LmbE family N-acetylglucosaminyl deacetylase [Hymenobacter artigasi]
MIRSLRPLAVLAFLIINSQLLISEARAQTPKTYTSSEILLGLKKLNVLGSVMYIAAHPDDENTRLIAYMANERLLETSYLSATRGDGGQNLIGPELREGLGVIRTQELLAARRLDGGRQFFTRANDFGFSKTSDETFRIWDKEQVLADMVWVIRQRRPDVLITRFPPDARAGHGHHQASAILAAEAFDAAGDPKRFPEQLQYVQAWQPKRLFWNTGSFFVKPGENMDGYLRLDAGGYNPLLGQSYGEIAARSRSNHRSQGFGSAAQRGEALEYFQPVKGDKATKDLFEGVDQTWNRVPGGAAVGKLIEEVIRKYDASNPSASVAGLLKVREQLNKFHQGAFSDFQSKELDSEAKLSHAKDELSGAHFWVATKQAQIDELLKACLGLSIDATAASPTTDFNISGKSSALITYEVLNRSNVPVQLIAKEGYVYSSASAAMMGITALNGIHGNEGQKIELARDKKVTDTISLKGKFESYLVSQPYWMRENASVGMYSVKNQSDRGKPENSPVGMIHFRFLVGGQMLSYNVPVQYKHTDPVLGELYQPLAVVPPVLVNLPPARSYVFADAQPKTVPVTLRAGRAGVSGRLALALPAGWKCEPATADFALAAKDEELTVNFQVQPLAGAAPGRAELRAIATLAPPSPQGEGGRGGEVFTRGIQKIEYPHIPTQFLFPEAVAPLVKLDLKRRGQNVAYLMGAGDEVPDALRQIGYTVTLLKPEEISAARLKPFDALVVGIRAYNTVDALKTRQAEILKYIEAGGNVVVQYVVNRGTVLPEIGPYPMTLSNDRVTVEDAPVTLTKHPLLAAPNKITEQDFKGWVQEQGLYYPSKWDPKYQTVISSHDPGEAAKESAILVTDYGKGHYIYTGLSLFRELPAGVPGAYRIITNMISYGKEPVQ